VVVSVAGNRSSRVSVRVGLPGCVCRSRWAAREAGSGSRYREDEGAAGGDHGAGKRTAKHMQDAMGGGGEHGVFSMWEPIDGLEALDPKSSN